MDRVPTGPWCRCCRKGVATPSRAVFRDCRRQAARTTCGLDFAIAPEPAISHEPWPAGTYYWSGIYGTYFWVDPVNDMVVAGTVQRAWAPGSDVRATLVARDVAGQAIYAALNR